MRKNVKKGKTKKFIIIISSIISFVILLLISLDIIINLSIYKSILEQKENENIEIDIPINYIFLSKKNSYLINSLNKNINFNFKNYSYTMHSSNVVKNGITSDIKVIQNLEVVLLVTPNFSPSSSCVIFFSFLHCAINFPIFT